MEYRGLLSCRRPMDSRFRGNDRRKVCFNSFSEMPVKAAFMRLPGHTLPRRGGLGPGKREAVPGKATKKCRVDQAWHKDMALGHPECCQGLASGHQKRIHRSSAGANPARRISLPWNRRVLHKIIFLRHAFQPDHKREWIVVACSA